MKFYTYKNAVLERDKLNNYIFLVENHNTNSFDDWVIKQYAITGSVTGVIKLLPSCSFSTENILNKREHINAIILKSPEDELHRIVQRQYKRKSRHRKKIHF